METTTVTDTKRMPERTARTQTGTTSPILFFLGSERSGTTFVQETLNKFYDVSQGNETQWVVENWAKARSSRQSQCRVEADD